MGEHEHNRSSRCARAREWVSLREDAELSEFEKLLLRRHLGRCADCRSFAHGVAATTRVIRSSDVASPSRSVVVGRMRAPRFGLRARLGVVALAGAAGLGALVGWITASSTDGPAPLPQPVITIAELPAAPPDPPIETETTPPPPPGDRPTVPV